MNKQIIDVDFKKYPLNNEVFFKLDAALDPFQNIVESSVDKLVMFLTYYIDIS